MFAKICKNVILFLVGFCTYITIEVCWRGYSFVLMGICGGLAIVILDKINNKISWNVDILLQGLLGSVLITTFELVIGEIALHTSLIEAMWDYSNIPFNFDGVICLSFSVVWLFLSLAAIMLADAINYYVFHELPVPYYKLFGRTIIKFKG